MRPIHRGLHDFQGTCQFRGGCKSHELAVEVVAQDFRVDRGLAGSSERNDEAEVRCGLARFQRLGLRAQASGMKLVALTPRRRWRAARAIAVIATEFLDEKVQSNLGAFDGDTLRSREDNQSMQRAPQHFGQK